MCAKLIVWALDWDGLLDRAQRALRDMGVYGVKTTIPYYQEIINCADFQSGKFDTSFVETHPELIQYSVHRTSRDLAVAIGAAIAAHTGL
jgi:pyruvate carboxylase subunit A